MTARFIDVGPGAADLLTVRASGFLSRCGTCLFDSGHATKEVLALCPPEVRLVDTAGMLLVDVVAEIRSARERGDLVVRLIPGDPASNPGVELEIRALDAEGIEWQIVPGVPVSGAAAAALGVDLSAPGGVGSVHIARVGDWSVPVPSGSDPASPLPSDRSDLTMVPHVGAPQLAEVIRQLGQVHGSECPAGIVMSAGREGETTVVGTLGNITDRLAGANLSTDMVVIAGRPLAQRGDDDGSGVDREPAPAPATVQSTVPSTVPTPAPSTVPSTSPEPVRASVRPSVVTTTARIPSATPGRILVLGGTDEARGLADLMVAAGLDVVTSLAGKASRPRLPRGEVRIGGFGGAEGLAHWLSENGVSAVIDATDPFATGISASATRAAQATGTPLLRVYRPPWTPEDGDHWIHVTDTEAAARLVRQRFRRPMLTVGRRGPTAFAGDTRGSYLIRCGEPPPGPLPHRYLLVLDRGPFGVESERTIMSRHRIDVLVTRNSGGQASVATLHAARDLRIPIVMVDRPAGAQPDQGGPDAIGRPDDTDHVADAGPLIDTVHSVDDAARWLVRRFGSR